MATTELAVEMDLDRILFTQAQILRFMNDRDEGGCDSYLTPEQFDRYAREVMWSMMQRRPQQSWQFQRTSLVVLSLDLVAMEAEWMMLEHIGSTDTTQRYLLSRWWLRGPERGEPHPLYQREFSIEGPRVRGVMLCQEGKHVFPTYHH